MKKLKNGTEHTVEEVALRNLGVSSTDDINKWFQKSYAGDYRIDGLEKAVDMIRNGGWERIQVVGDYDVDGTTATAQFRLCLKKLGYPVYDRIPRRFSEGFGMNPSIVGEIPDGKTLIITCDNGIAAFDAVALAKKRGFTVIVTDHHLPVVENGTVKLPDADLIIDPNAIPGSADFNGYCGSGLAYRLLKLLVETEEKNAEPGSAEARDLRALRLIIEPLAMMGTIGDVVTLREENYVIARNGLSKLAKRCASHGMVALHDKLWIVNPTASDIGYKSGPCVNANGRLTDDGASKSVDLLASMDYIEAARIADETIAANNSRKEQVSSAMMMAEEYIAANHAENDLPMFVVLPHTNGGIIGIVAGKLAEKYGVPVFAFTESGSYLKGSGRSIPGVDLKSLLDEHSDLIVKYGGHEGAAGLIVEKAKLTELHDKTNSYAKEHGIERLHVDELRYDLEIDAADIKKYLDETLRFGPFGEGNDPIVFKINHFRLVPNPDGKLKTYIGSSGIKISSDYGQAISFSLADRLSQSKAIALTLYGTLSYSYFKGEATPQVEMIDFDEELPEREETPLMQALRRKAAEGH